MAPTPSVKVVKTASFRGGQHVYSNRYHFSGGTPADDSHWQTLFTNIRNAEKLICTGDVYIIEMLGYAAGSDVPVSTWSGSVVSTGSFANAVARPLEVCALIRYTTTQKTTKNHPIYLFNYVHRANGDGTSADTELLNPAQKTAIETYASAWLAGFSDGTNTYVRAGPNGAVAQTRSVSTYVTHRDFRL